jgi:hypothetical protein
MSGLRFRATAPEEADRIREFLAGVFHLTTGAPAFEPRLIHWKYYQARPDWTGPRSYILERDGEIASHGCVWPMPFATSSRNLPACQIIDWAATPAVPGAGTLLRREIEKMVAVSVAIGGSPDSLKVIPRSGYSTVASFRKYVRIVRPFHQFTRRPDPQPFRRFAKLVRNALWSLTPAPALPAGWTVEPFSAQALGLPAPDYASTARSPELYRYLLDCPSGELSAFVLKKDGRETGYFLLNQVDGQTRIADLQTSDWPAGVIAATRTAALNPATCEIVANASLDRFAHALAHSGYQLRGEQPVFLLDRSKSLPSGELHITPADFDDFFARFPDSPFAA